MFLQTPVRRCPFCFNALLRNVSAASTAAPSSKPIKPVQNKTVCSSENNFDVNLVSPPDPNSNIRKIIYSTSNPTVDENLLNKEQLNTYEWNNKFWKEHNSKFFEEKKKFIANANVTSVAGKDVSDKLSVFYKEFLEQNHDTYMQYNRQWYQRNFSLLWKSFQTSMRKKFQR